MEDPRKMVEGIRVKMEMQEIAENLEANWEGTLIAAKGLAKAKKAIFDALIKEGFTEYQALILTDLQLKPAPEGGK